MQLERMSADRLALWMKPSQLNHPAEVDAAPRRMARSRLAHASQQVNEPKEDSRGKSHE